MIIYQPYIKEMIPAFATNKIEIPFSNNPAISLGDKDSNIDDISGFVLKVLGYNTGALTCILTSTNWAYNKKKKTGVVTFNIPAGERSKFTQGQYYKFQLAYSDSAVNGDQLNITDQQHVFSIVSIGRCLGETGPTISICNGGMDGEPVLGTESLSQNIIEFTGKYETSILSEPMYRYRFIFRNKDTEEVIEDTDWILHNVDEDIIDSVAGTRTSRHKYKTKYEMDKWIVYEIVFQVQTVNEFIKEVACPIIYSGAPPTKFQGTIATYQDAAAKDNGYIRIDIVAEPNKLIRGSFELLRTSNHKRWDVLTTFKLTKMSDISRFTWKDWSVEQGIPYTYAIRQVANGIVSERIESAPVIVEYDHIFLSDADRQLKLAFNPAISSIKDVIQETKIETLGSQYPFFFKNDTIKYKEFPVSGLLSYLMDDDQCFITNNDLNLVDPVKDANNERIAQNRPRTTNLTHYNFGSERTFKFEVLEWLNNGKPKLFRSPSEGNYIVRLMNTSLTPNTQVGRMLHSFSSTAYEIMEHSVDNLQKEKILDLKHIEDEPYNSIIHTLNCYQIWHGLSQEDIQAISGDTLTVVEDPKGTIENVIWQVARVNTSDYIILTTADGLTETFYNNTIGTLQTPHGVKYKKIEVYKNMSLENKYGGVITYTRSPEYGEAELGKDDYADMVSQSYDMLITVHPNEKIKYNKAKPYEYNLFSVDKEESTGLNEIKFLDDASKDWVKGRRTPSNILSVDNSYGYSIASKNIFQIDTNKQYTISWKLSKDYTLIVRQYREVGGNYIQSRTDEFKYNSQTNNMLVDFFTKRKATDNSVTVAFSVELHYKGSLLTTENDFRIKDLQTKVNNGDLGVVISQKNMTLYKIYGLVAHAEQIDAEVTPQIKFKSLSKGAETEEIIDLSDGQIRYFYDLPSDLAFEKTLGVHLTLYAYGFRNE